MKSINLFICLKEPYILCKSYYLVLAKLFVYYFTKTQLLHSVALHTSVPIGEQRDEGWSTKIWQLADQGYSLNSFLPTFFSVLGVISPIRCVIILYK